MFRAIVICCAIVVAFDAAASLASKLTAIPYGWFALPQNAMYLAMGFVLFRSFAMDARFFTVLVSAAACEATVGWSVSALIGPGKPPETAFVFLAVSALFAIALQTIFGIIGACISRVLTRWSSSAKRT